MLQLDYFKNVRSPQCEKQITITEYINIIKSGFEVDKIERARQVGKGQVYDNIKMNRPCVSFNFHFDGYKENKKIIGSTGLLYFDIDGIGMDELCQLDYSKVYIAHKSFGGKGTSIIVKVSGITTDNFKDAYMYIAKQLAIEDIIDMNAVKMVQSTVLSFDASIYINDEAFCFVIKEKVSFREELRKKGGIYPWNDTFLKNNYLGPLRNTNAGDYVPADLAYKVFPEKIDTAKVVIPRNIREGNRSNVLLAELNNLVFLNPMLTYNQVLERAFQLHQINTNNRLPVSEVEKIAKSIWKYKMDGSLKPINNQPRTVIFNPTCKYSREEKIGIVNAEVGKIKSNKTKLRIQEVIETWDAPEKITIKTVAAKVYLSEVRLKHYWKFFKEKVKEINLQQRVLKVSKITSDTPVESEVPLVIEEEVITIKDTLASIFELADFIKSHYPLKYSSDGVKRIFDFFTTEQLPCTKTNVCKILEIEYKQCS